MQWKALLIALGLIFSGCAAAPIKPLPKNAVSLPPEQRLDTYMQSRIQDLGYFGYKTQGMERSLRMLPDDALGLGSPKAASWAKQGLMIKASGCLVAALLEGGFIYASTLEGNPLGSATWAYGLLPSFLVGFSIHYMAQGFFIEPAGRLVNLDMKRQLQLTGH
jgi:hypothetical protein